MPLATEGPRIAARIAKAPSARSRRRLFEYLPRGNMLDDQAWQPRHNLLRGILLLHGPGLLLFGLWRGFDPLTCIYVVAPLLGCLAMSTLVTRRRLSSFFVTAGLVYGSSALVGLSDGAIEAHFHFFIIIGFIALYQDWVPFLWNIVFTVISHGVGSAWSTTLIFNHLSGQRAPWLWSLIHGVSVLAACVGMVIFWRYSETETEKAIELRTRIAETEVERRRFTSDLLVNLARRNQAMLHRQLTILNQLEEKEHDPDALAELFQLDHLATRIRRNAESLLVLSGEDPPRVWAEPVRLLDVVRAAIAETEDLDRVIFEVDEHLAVLGQMVTGVTHMLAELLENAVRFSDPTTNVTVRVRADPRSQGAQVLTVEDWGVGMPPEAITAANLILADPPDVDLSTSRRFGLHVVSRLAKRHAIQVRLSTTGFAGVTAAVVLPASVFVPARVPSFPTPAAPDRQRTGHEPNGWDFNGQDLNSRDLNNQDLNGHEIDVRELSSRATSRRALRAGPDHRSGPDQRNGADRGGAEHRNGADHRNGSEGSGRQNWDLRPAAGPPPDHEVIPPAPVLPPAGAVPDPGGPLLAQRVPQRNLSPHLRRQNGSGDGQTTVRDLSVHTPDGPTPAARQAADALSRYQANRQAALRRNAGSGPPAPDGQAEEDRTW